MSRLPLLALLVFASGCDKHGLGRWSAAMQHPDSVEAHLLGNISIPSQAEVDAGAVFDQWTDEQRFTLNAAQLSGLQELLSSATAVSDKPREPTLCMFHADFALVWLRAGEKVWAVFCLTCGETAGSSGIQGFDLQRVGAFATTLFPAHVPFQRVAAGKKPFEEANAY